MNALSNDKRYEDFIQRVKDAGADAGNGERAKPRLAVAVALAVQDRVISLDKDKKTGRDDIDEAYDTYLKVSSKKNPEDHSANGRKVKTSELRAIGIAASKPTADFVNTIQVRLPEMLKEMNKQDLEPISEYAAMVKAARTQKAQDDDLSDDQIQDALSKSTPKDKEALKELESLRKRMDKLIDGSAGVQINDPDLVSARAYVNDLCLAYMIAAEQAELAALASKHGMTVTVAGNVDINTPASA
jgi:hypothetical protein